MKKIILSQAALIALSLLDINSTDGIDVELVNKKVTELSAELTKSKADLTAKDAELSGVKTALQTLQNQAAAQKKLAATKIVEDAIAAGKINATEKDSWVALAESNEDLATKTLAAIPATKNLGVTVNNPAGGAVMTSEDFQKLSVEEQIRYKNSSPELYKLFVESLEKSQVRAVKA